MWMCTSRWTAEKPTPFDALVNRIKLGVTCLGSIGLLWTVMLCSLVDTRGQHLSGDKKALLLRPIKSSVSTLPSCTMESPWKGIWLPRPTPAIRKPLTEEDLDGLDDEYFEPDPNCWDEDEDCDLFDYGTVVSTEEMAQAEKDWKIRKKGNVDPEPHGVHITVRREENKEDHAKIHCDLYYQIMINRFVDEIHKSKEEKMGRANVEEAKVGSLLHAKHAEFIHLQTVFSVFVVGKALAGATLVSRTCLADCTGYPIPVIHLLVLGVKYKSFLQQV
ncbi:hypothetical protein RHSIM_Rhsim06G0016600 [Rhododendron simsii]|uniref:Uncharacterized protein n=1 Tax=Rhododendron simsii TaxID=118357 RepID=A0A834LLD7_RHOSS|nr:hypothetical protein RHSIM_Rhsim06G0016600 [Rhododendron simsii]